MKYLSLILISLFAISCSNSEFSNYASESCTNDKSIFGSFAYNVGDHNIGLFWNHYADKTHASFYKVFIKDQYGNMFTSDFTTENWEVIHHNTKNEEGTQLGDVIELVPGDWYSIDLIAFDKDKNHSISSKEEPIKRGTNIQLIEGTSHIELSFCGPLPYRFY